MVIQAGVRKDFGGEPAETIERLGWGEAPAGDVGQERLELRGGHATWATGSR